MSLLHHVEGDSQAASGEGTVMQEVRASTAALAAATAGSQTPLELAASVATAVPGPHHQSSSSSAAQPQPGSAGGCAVTAAQCMTNEQHVLSHLGVAHHVSLHTS